MHELTDFQVKLIMTAFHQAADAIETAERKAWNTRKEAQPSPEPNLDVWLVYDVASNAYNVQFWLRSDDVTKQPMLCDFHRDGGRDLALFACTCCDTPTNVWSWGNWANWDSVPHERNSQVWREALIALRELTLKPKQEQIANEWPTCGNAKGHCEVCSLKEEGVVKD